MARPAVPAVAAAAASGDCSRRRMVGALGAHLGRRLAVEGGGGGGGRGPGGPAGQGEGLPVHDRHLLHDRPHRGAATERAADRAVPRTLACTGRLQAASRRVVVVPVGLEDREEECAPLPRPRATAPAPPTPQCSEAARQPRRQL